MMTTSALLLAGLAAAAVIPQDAAVKEELERHQGTWIVLEMRSDGQLAPDDVVKSIRRIVEKDQVVWKRNGMRFATTRIVIDPKAEPKTIDVIPDSGPNRDEPIQGIYKLEGDELTICMAKPQRGRPTEFRADKGSGYSLTKLRRESSKP